LIASATRDEFTSTDRFCLLRYLNIPGIRCAYGEWTLQKRGITGANDDLEGLDQRDEFGENCNDEDDQDGALFDESWKAAVLDTENLEGEKVRFKTSNHWWWGFMKSW
jgi:hypothetical protein